MSFAVATIEQRKLCKRQRERLAGLLLVSAVFFGVHGCAAKQVQHEDTREVVTTSSDGRGQLSSETRTEESHTETEHATSSGPGCSGVLSCGVSAIGEVLAFPFRAVGYIFQALF